MKNQEEFDDLLKSKFFTENNFPFEEDKWARMEELIIKDELNRKKRKYFLFYLGGFISALIIVLPIYFMKISNQVIENVKNQKLNITIKEKSKQHEKTNNITLNKLVSKTKKDKIIITKSLTNQTISKEKDTNNSANNREKKSKNNHLRNSKKSTKNLKIKYISPEIEVIKKDLTLEKLFELEEKKHAEIDKNLNDTDNSFVKENLNKKDSVSILDKEKTDSLKENNSSKNNDKNEIEVKNENLNIQKNSLFFIVGGIYHLGFAKNDGNSFSQLISLTYLYKNKFSIGLSYFIVNNMSFEKEFKVRSYDFGYRDKITTIKQKNLQYISLPINYFVNFNKNTFSFGINPSFLFLNKTELIEKNKTAFSETLISEKSSFNYSHGLSKLDLQLTLGYSRCLTKKIILGLDFSYGFIDVRKKEWTTNSKFENNKYLSIHLNYKLK